MHCALSNDMQAVRIASPAGLGSYSQSIVIERMQAVRSRVTRVHYAINFKHGSFSDKCQYRLMLATQAWKLRAANETWQHHVFNPAAQTHVDSLTETVEAVLDFIAAFGPGALSLGGFQPTAVQGEHLSAVLRASSTWRDQIPGWHEALSVARAAIERSGLDPEDALFGML